MRTKTLLCAAALAAGVVSSMAQSNVYSLNVVGYVNVSTRGGGNFSMIANPLNNTASNGNDITNLFAVAQDGDSIFTWNPAAQDLGGTIYSFSSFLNAWDGHRLLRAGEAIFYLNAGANRTNTFVGEVLQGSYTNPIPSPTVLGSGNFNAYGSSAPLGGSFTNAIVGIVPSDGDSIFTWDQTAQDLSGTIASFSSFLNAWDNPSIQVPPGIGFFYLRAGGNQNAWVRNFTVQ
jgi:hypothetical protein